jgi:hypothetical protein
LGFPERRAECPQGEGQLAGRALPHGAAAVEWEGPMKRKLGFLIGITVEDELRRKVTSIPPKEEGRPEHA